jgi:hypothetical protein
MMVPNVEEQDVESEEQGCTGSIGITVFKIAGGADRIIVQQL